MNPVVSIITPSFNRADIIHETAESIFKQTYPHWEWMIVDDGSTDNSWELIKSYAEKDSRVRVFQRDRDPKGAAVCRNIAVEKATGKYVIFLDTDDLLASFCIEQRVKAAESEVNADVVIFPMLMFKTEPTDLGLLWNIDKDRDDIERILFGDAICQGTGTIWKRDKFLEVGAWRQDLAVWQDVELHLRTMIGDVIYKKRMDLKPDIFLRISDVSLSRTGYHSINKWRSRVKVLLQTIEGLKEKGHLAKYIHGIQNVAIDLVTGGVKSGYWAEVSDLTKTLGRNGVLNESQQTFFKRYMLFRRLKGYKINSLDRLFDTRIQKMITPYDNTLNKVVYEGEIVI